MNMATGPRQPKHERISAYVRNFVRSSGLKPGQAIMTEQELARMFHCSSGTVRHALTILVGEGLIHRRRGSGSYVAEQTQAVERRRIVFAVLDLANTFVARFSSALNVEIAKRGFHMVLCSADGRRENDLQFVDQLAGPDLLGLIRFPSWMDTEKQTRDVLRQMGIRYVIVNDFWTDCWRDHHVAFDERTAMDAASGAPGPTGAPCDRLCGLERRRAARQRHARIPRGHGPVRSAVRRQGTLRL